jgi:peptidoglycan biosynthesis protein MviN/MurJ (putative lipid II flippase)
VTPYATVYFLTVAYGVTGTALSVLIAAFVMPTFVIYTNRRVLHLANWPMFRDCYVRTAVLTTAVGLFAWFALRGFATNLLVTVALIGVTTIAGLLAGASAGVLDATDRESLLTMVRRLRQGKRTDEAGRGGDIDEE